ncbi:SGNH/GDSL hydrolase family protein [Qipengyuania mesophila]|uniref:SGNH/GDSL hydrolase family protein n=1 Tax=Qipengyuania mesophila TaxID=2867246 RepID=UPI0035197671
MRRWINTIGWSIVTTAGLLLGFSAWVIAPFGPGFFDVLTTTETLVRAPFAKSLVIGDSRVQFAEAPEGVVFAGFGGATSQDLERLTRIVCPVTTARVTIALGVNDAKRRGLDLAATGEAFEAIARNCAQRELRLAQAWPVESGVEPSGGDYDPVAIEAINRHLADLARRHRADLLGVPPLAPGFTYDGVHFVAPVSRNYADWLAFADPETRD